MTTVINHDDTMGIGKCKTVENRTPVRATMPA
jgi:hypothetical protein